MLVGYMRVSSDSDRQTTDLQRDALLSAGVDSRHLTNLAPGDTSVGSTPRQGVSARAGPRRPGPGTPASSLRIRPPEHSARPRLTPGDCLLAFSRARKRIREGKVPRHRPPIIHSTTTPSFHTSFATCLSSFNPLTASALSSFASECGVWTTIASPLDSKSFFLLLGPCASTRHARIGVPGGAQSRTSLALSASR